MFDAKLRVSALVRFVCLSVFCLSLTHTPLASAQSYSVLYTFAGGTDGSSPNGHLIQDSAGNLYGTTTFGGSSGQGTIFKIDPAGTETVLYTFTGGADGAQPSAGLFRDPAGNLYGPTTSGGASGRGTLFKLDTTNTLTTLHSFEGGSDGWAPESRLISFNGQLYGTTRLGGGTGCGNSLGCGIIFRASYSGNLKVLYRFTGADDGSNPQALVSDSAGNLYGAAQFPTNGSGTIFKLSTSGTLSVLFTFSNLDEGYGPTGPLLRDTNGNFHGVTNSGGAGIECPNRCGVVFRVDSSGNETVHRFYGHMHGGTPNGGLLDLSGALIGVTEFYGDLSCTNTFLTPGCGVLYEIGNTGQYTVLHAFAGGQDGSLPSGEPILGSDGSIYGVTLNGGLATACTDGCGTIFKYTP